MVDVSKKKENIKSLVSNLVEKYKSMFNEFNYTDTFSALILRYEQNTDPTPHTENENTAVEPRCGVYLSSYLPNINLFYFIFTTPHPHMLV